MNELFEAELARVLRTLQRGHDVLPFLNEMLPTGGTGLAPLPRAMMDQLRT